MKSLILTALALAILVATPSAVLAATEKAQPPEVEWRCSYPTDEQRLPEALRLSMPAFCTVRGWHKEPASGLWSSDSICAVKIFQSGIALLFVVSNGETFPGSKVHVHNKSSNNGAYLGDTWFDQETNPLYEGKEDFFVSRCGAQLQALPERARKELKGFDPTVP